MPKVKLMSDIWQRRFFRLQAEIQNVYEVGVLFKPETKDIPDVCESASKEFFISNDMHVVDNERYAKENWGEGKYFRVVRARARKECDREKRD